MNINFLIMLPGFFLCVLLALAVWHDVRSRRIPNRLVLLGALAGLALHTILPAGAGLFNEPFGGLGFLTSLAGLGVGLAILLPMYVLRAMGAGDVKLMAMVGAFLGPQAIIGAALLSMLAGGLLALAVALWTGMFVKVLMNIYHLLLQVFVRTLADASVGINTSVMSTGKLAYAIAITTGTMLQIFLARTHVWSLL